MFKTKSKNYPLPLFFPDATRGVVRTLTTQDILETKTPGVLVNTWHLYKKFGKGFFEKWPLREFMNWEGALISDSGGFQVMSLAKKNGGGSVTDSGVIYVNDKTRSVFTPEDSISYQFEMGTDLLVVLDDFTMPNSTSAEAKETVKRTLQWAERSKKEFEKQVLKRKIKNKPYLIAVVQGGEREDLRRECARELVKMGFDGFGYGGWPIDSEGNFDFDTARIIAEEAPEGYLLYGLGIGKPEDIEGCVRLGFNIFDCVLPTRDARHKRLYVQEKKGYSFYQAGKAKDLGNREPVSTLCDCELCREYSKGYLAHLFQINETAAMRLATKHNLRFYSMLMEGLR